ncbi:hypothetical protein LOD99_2383 [Oopsacas minuta]|uniref:CARD domain-containing protein n=1 Tax=Oopsacas minuta TaxID=111878 RepID=A0AAV7K1F7_9METZ|nr:hypothetical protein LOD99_2383 [Oopsacas minuta]
MMDYSNSTDIECVTSIEDTISINTVSDNISNSILIKNVPLPEPYSLAPYNHRLSVSSNISEQGHVINPYFKHHQPTSSTSDKETTIERTKTMVSKDRSEDIAERAIQIITDSRSKLTKLITDVTVLFPFLKEKVVLSQDDCDRICLRPISSLKTDAFIDIIITRGPNGVAYFCEALKEHYNHIYETLKNIFEVNGVEIDAILNKKIKGSGRISKYFSSIEEILGPEFTREREGAKSLLDSISAINVENVNYKDLRLKYLELQKLYEPIQNTIDTVSRDLMVRYNTFLIENECLNYENKAAWITIDKLLDENRGYYEKANSQNLKIEQLQEDIDRRNRISDDDEQKISMITAIMGLKPSDEKLELIKFQDALQSEKHRNKELIEQIDAIRIQKNDIFTENQQTLKENVELKTQLAALPQSKKRNMDEIPLKSYDKNFKELEEARNTLSRTQREIGGALSKIGGKNSFYKEVNVKNTVMIANKIKEHLAQSLEIGLFFSDSLDPSLVKSIQPGDRVIKINNIKLANVSDANFPKFMIQQAESSLKLLIARGPINHDVPYEEHSYNLMEDELYTVSRSASPNLIDTNRLTPVPTPSTCTSCMLEYHRRVSTQSQFPTIIQSEVNRSCIHKSNDTLNISDIQLNIPLRNMFPYDLNMTTSCPQTPLFNNNKNCFPKTNLSKAENLSLINSDSSSDSFSQDSDPIQQLKPTLLRPNSLPKGPNFAAENMFDLSQFEPVVSPSVPRNFPIDNFDSVSDIFRADTGLTGMVICTRRNPTIRLDQSNGSIASVNRDQIRTSVPNQLFLRHAKISGGFGNPFFLHSDEELNEYKLKSGQKIFQINDLTTEYLTYEMFIDQCHINPSITLYVSHVPSTHFKPEELSLRDHFYVIPRFITKRESVKGELFVSPSCVYLVTDTMEQNDNWSKQNRFWHVTRIDPRNCNNIENGRIPSDLWLSNTIECERESLVISLDSQLTQRPPSISTSTSDYDLENVDFYYNLESVKDQKFNENSKSPFKCYTLVIRKNLLPQPVILFGYHWEDISEKLTTNNSIRQTRRSGKFQLITSSIVDDVNYAKNAELEEKQNNCEIIHYKGNDGKSRVVNVKTLTECIESYNTPVILCPFAQIALAPALIKLNPIVIKLRFQYTTGLNITNLPPAQRFHFDDMLQVGIKEDKYLKKLVKMIDANRVLYEWKAVLIENYN